MKYLFIIIGLVLLITTAGVSTLMITAAIHGMFISPVVYTLIAVHAIGACCGSVAMIFIAPFIDRR